MAAQVEIDDQASVTDLDDGEIIDPIPDDEADSLSIVLLDEGNPERDVITTCFLSGMSTTAAAAAVANETTIVAVSKNSSEGITTRAKFLAFRVFTEAMARKNGGDANVKYGWYAGSKEEIEGAISFGFSSREIRRFENQAGSHGIGIHLVPSKFSVIAAADTEPDEEGLRYLLLCRIILGKPELIVSGSKQSYPSSNEFDSGVDNLQNPRKYVIWSSTMNSYILPSYIVSFRSPNLRGTRPRSPWVSFASLMSILAKSIDPSRMNLIISTCNDFRKGKIRRDELVRKMREVAGDNLLAHIIKNHGDKNKANV